MKFVELGVTCEEAVLELLKAAPEAWSQTRLKKKKRVLPHMCAYFKR